MFLLQAQETAGLAADVHHVAFEPFLLGLIALLPLIGFLINATASMVAARNAPRPALAQEAGHEAEYASEEEAHADDHVAHPATPEPHPVQSAGWTHSLPSLVAPGVIALSS